MSVQEAQPLDESIRERDAHLLAAAGAMAGVSSLVLLLSAMGIFSLMSVSVSRRTREIWLRAALGANPRNLLAEVLSRAFVLMGSGITAGGALLLLFVALGGGPTGSKRGRRCPLRQVSCGDRGSDARRVPACLYISPSNSQLCLPSFSNPMRSMRPTGAPSMRCAPPWSRARSAAETDPNVGSQTHAVLASVLRTIQQRQLDAGAAFSQLLRSPQPTAALAPPPAK